MTMTGGNLQLLSPLPYYAFMDSTVRYQLYAYLH